MSKRFVDLPGKARGEQPYSGALSAQWWERLRLQVGTGARAVSLFTANGCCLATRVRIAKTFASRSVGLLARSSLADDEGLLMVPGGTIHTFGMRFPIDLVFLDQEMRVVTFCRRVEPWRISFAPPRVAFALELAAGRIDAVRLGARERIVMRTTHNQ